MVRTVTYYTATVKFYDSYNERSIVAYRFKIPSKYSIEQAKKELNKELEYSDFFVIDIIASDEEVRTETLKLKDILSLNPIIE